MLPMENWYETNALFRLRRGTAIALDLGVAALALVVLLGMAILAATRGRARFVLAVLILGMAVLPGLAEYAEAVLCVASSIAME